MQPTLEKEVAIFQKAKFTASSPVQTNITNAIVKMLVTDIRPLHMVENEGFKDLILLLDPRYTMVSRKHIQNNLLPQLFSTTQDKIKSLLSSANTCNVTLDIWSSRKMQSFLGITCHYLTDAFEMKSLLLSCSRLVGHHTGEHIVSEFEDVALTYNISEKIFKVISDNASNMKKGFNDRQTQLPGFKDVHDSDSESDSEMELQLGIESSIVTEEVENIETMDLDTYYSQ
uniref:HAT C-terminal dimerisation domain-containing protein n=1 Tax=Amphimedon queenslandica TaxID=400682 RepID=A0A1X7TG49_AMPQE